MTNPATRLQTSLAQWRDSLVNLSGTNRLLNYRPTRASTLEISGPDAATLLQAVASGRELRTRGTKPEPKNAAAEAPDDGLDLRSAALVSLDKTVPALEIDVIIVNKTQRDVDRILKNLATAATREFLDRGIWILYIAAGTISWQEDGGDPRRSPLILVPVQLRSNGPRQTPTLSRSDEDLVVNPALSLKFSQYDILLPNTQQVEAAIDSGGLSVALDLFRTAVPERDWVVDDQCILATFMFAKEAMYRDLLENQDRILSHTIVAALGGKRPAEADELTFDDIDTDRIDALAPPETTSLILDADSSQRAAVAAALAGRSFVLDGPPGTGKSQTIATMIGALLERGKTVLFVSEKAVALDVVKKRLLDRGARRLHSRATQPEGCSKAGGGTSGRGPCIIIPLHRRSCKPYGIGGPLRFVSN